MRQGGGGQTSSDDSPPSPLSTQRPQPRPHFFGKQLRLFPRRKMPTLVEPVVVNEVVIGALGPATRRLIVLARKDADGGGDGNIGGGEEVEMGLPIKARRRDPRIR